MASDLSALIARVEAATGPGEADFLNAAAILTEQAQKLRAAADQPGWRKGMPRQIRARATGFEAVAAWLKEAAALRARQAQEGGGHG
jgi:hypothetical protein